MVASINRSDTLHWKRKGLLIGLYVTLSMCLNAQEVSQQDTTLGEDNAGLRQDVLMINTAGDIEALENCDEYALANFLNTSPQIAKTILERRRSYKDELTKNCLNKGDIVKVDYGCDLLPDSLSCMGKVICKYFSNNLGQYLFSNYWNGKGDIELTVEQFAGILLCIKQNNISIPSSPDTLYENCNNLPVLVSFYNTQYEKEFGNATLFYNEDGQAIGFLDVYDFDAKKWGIRPFKYELCIRMVALLSPATAADFTISYKAK